MMWRNQAACLILVILMSGCASKQSSEKVEADKTEQEITDTKKSSAQATDNISQLLQSGAMNSNDAVKKAIKKLTEEIKNNPSDPDLYFKRGFLYFQNAGAVSTTLDSSASKYVGIYEKAIKDFSSVVELRPKDYIAYRWRAESYVNLNNLDDAINDTNKLLELDPESRSHHDLKMAIYNKKKQFDKALKEANIVIGICEKDPSIKGIALSYKDRAYIYQNLGEFDKAEKDFKKVIALLEPLEDKGSKILLGGTYATLSTFYLKQKKYKQVIAKSKKAIEISKELTPPFARLNMGEAYSAIGDHKNAISTYEEAIKIHKNFQKAYQLCSAEYKKLGNKKKAAEYLAKYEELEKKGNSEESRKSM